MAGTRTLTEEQKAKMAAGRAAAKARKEAEAAAQVTAAAPATQEQKEDVSSFEDSKAMGKMLAADNKVQFIIPIDPSLSTDNQYWERSFNGLILRFKRGVPYEQPKYIVNFIMQTEQRRQESRDAVAEYSSASGKRLE